MEQTEPPKQVARMHRLTQAWAKNPLSNPEDRKLALSRIRSDTQKAVRLRKRSQAVEMAPDTPESLKKASNREHYHRRKRSAQSEILFNPGLKAWMKRFAVWLAGCETKPPLTEQLNQLAFLSKMKISKRHLYLLHKRQDFATYYESLQNDALALHREEYFALIPKMVKVQEVALDQALMTGDIRPVSKIVVEGMERLVPKKREEAVSAKEFHIHLAPGQTADKLLEGMTEIVVDQPEATDG